MRFSTVATIVAAVAVATPALAYPLSTRGVEGELATRDRSAQQAKELADYPRRGGGGQHPPQPAPQPAPARPPLVRRPGVTNLQALLGNNGGARHNGGHTNGHRGSGGLAARDLDFEELYARAGGNDQQSSSSRHRKTTQHREASAAQDRLRRPSPVGKVYADVQDPIVVHDSTAAHNLHHPRPVRPNPQWVGDYHGKREDDAGLWERDLLEEILARSFYDELD